MDPYVSKYDTQPLPDPGNSSQDEPPPPQSMDPSKKLQVNWASPQPLETVTPPPATSSGGDHGKKDPPRNPLAAALPTPGQLQGRIREMFGPIYETVSVRPDDLLNLEQTLLNAAGALAQAFNTLVSNSEAAMTAGFWGLEEGNDEKVNDQVPLQAGSGERSDGGVLGYVYTDSARNTQKFVAALLPNQRSTLQHTADVVTLSGIFIELLNTTADAYGVGDQYSVFPDISPKHGGS